MPDIKSSDDAQIAKLRRKIEHFLRNTTPITIIRVAMFCGIKVPKNLIDKYMSN